MTIFIGKEKEKANIKIIGFIVVTLILWGVAALMIHQSIPIHSELEDVKIKWKQAEAKIKGYEGLVTIKELEIKEWKKKLESERKMVGLTEKLVQSYKDETVSRNKIIKILDAMLKAKGVDMGVNLE